MSRLHRRLTAILAAAAAALAAPRAAAHRIDHLSITLDASADGSTLSIEVSAEAKRILEARQSLSLLPSFLRPEERIRVAPEVYSQAGGYFPDRVTLYLDGKPFPLPSLALEHLEVAEKDAVDPAQAAAADPERVHHFIVGRAGVSLPPGEHTVEAEASGDSVIVLARKIAGAPAGPVVPYFVGMKSPAWTLTAAAPPEPELGFWATFGRFVRVGFDHILPPAAWAEYLRQKAARDASASLPDGLDHILFVLGLFLLCRGLGPLLWQVTAFTAAHSITLALALLDIVRLPEKPVEILIALSIAFVAAENLFHDKLSKWRTGIVFTFGLIHGLGFAGAFKDFGVPQKQFLAGLLSFNIGVELGQLTVVALALLLVGWFWKKPWYRRAIVLPASAAIALTGLWWAYQRWQG